MPASGGGSVVKRVREPVDRAVMDLSAPSLSRTGVLFAALAVKDGRSLLLILQRQREGDAADLVAWLGCQCMGQMSLHGTFMSSLRRVVGVLTPAVLHLI